MDGSGRALAGLRLLLTLPSGDVDEIAVTTDERGVFRLTTSKAQLRYRHDPTGDGPFRARWLPAGQTQPVDGLLEPSGGEAADSRENRRIVLDPPPRILDVFVTDEEGAPARDATVRFEGFARLDTPFESFPGHASWNGGVRFEHERRTDASGRASFALWMLDDFRYATLRAEREQRWSERRRLAPPLTLRQECVLQRGGRLLVEVLDPDGRPRADTGVWAKRSRERHRARRTEDGDYLFEELPPGRWSLDVANPWKGGRRQSTQVESRAGSEERVRVQLEEGRYRLALEARVLDPRGAPWVNGLPVLVHGSEGTQRIVSDEHGRLRLFLLPEESLRLEAEVGVDLPAVEPREQTVPFGARGIEFRVLEPLDEIALRFTARSVAGEATPVWALVDRGEGTPSLAVRPGETLSVLPHRDLRWRAIAPGYREATGAVTGSPVEVVLHPGFERELDVRGWDGDVGIGATLTSPTATGGATDGTGRIHLAADHWPTYEASLAGYDTLVLGPEEFLDLWLRETDRVLLPNDELRWLGVQGYSGD